jgi:hypothetical protein
MSNMLKGLIGGFVICGGVGLLVLFYMAGMVWIADHVTDSFWRGGLLSVGGFAGIGGAITALAAFMEDS